MRRRVVIQATPSRAADRTSRRDASPSMAPTCAAVARPYCSAVAGNGFFEAGRSTYNTPTTSPRPHHP